MPRLNTYAAPASSYR